MATSAGKGPAVPSGAVDIGVLLDDKFVRDGVRARAMAHGMTDDIKAMTALLREGASRIAR